MFTKSRRFTLKAVILASLSLFLFGCGTGSAPQNAPALKSVTGVVSDPVTGQPYANALVSAYAVDANGNRSAAPISVPASVRSDGQGNFVLNIPASYSGSIMVEATLTAGTGKRVLASAANIIRLFIPDVSNIHVVALNLANEMVVRYIEQNKGGAFTPDNFKKAILVLEAFFGPNFDQVGPVEIGSVPTPAQQRMIVMVRAINSLLDAGNTLDDLVTFTPGTTQISLGGGTVFTALNAALDAAVTEQINAGLISSSYVQEDIIPISEPVKLDTPAPATPQNLQATSTTDSVTLSWNAPTDTGDAAVTGYYVYRDGVFITALTGSTITYTDSNLDSDTTYNYELTARNAAGKTSAAAPVSATTKPILTYNISGKITSDGAGLASVYVAISGSGSGVFVTDSNGNYTITGVREGRYTITPSLQWYTFTPENISVVVTTSDITGKDFIAVAVPAGTITGTVTYPPGTIIGGTSYPSGMVIGGITYPTATIIGGVVYPTGTVIGGVSYPNGVIIGGVSYPAGTIVGGVAFPVGAVTAGFTYPSGVVIGGVTYPSGTISAGEISYPSGTVIGGVTYPSGTVIGGVTYPNGVIIGGVTYQSGTVVGGTSFPVGSIITGTTYPTGTVGGGLGYPNGFVTTILSWNGTITGKVTVSGVALAGVTVTITGGATDTTDINGDYHFDGLPNGAYTLTPSKTGYTFSPVSSPVSVTDINKIFTGKDFAATAAP